MKVADFAADFKAADFEAAQKFLSTSIDEDEDADQHGDEVKTILEAEIPCSRRIQKWRQCRSHAATDP